MKFVLIFLASFTVVFAVVPNGPCDTPSNGFGACTLLKQCPVLYDKTKVKPIHKDDENLLKNSVQIRDGRKVYVCCPKETSEEDPSDSDEELVENGPCKTPNNKQGSCQKLKSCKSLFRKFKEEKDNKFSVEFLQESFCFKKGSANFVCCVDKDIEPEEESTTEVPVTTTKETIEEETEPVWLRELKKKVPKAPECGFDVQYRIFGGEVADITDFPWTALLEYRKPGNEVGFNCGGSLINNRYVLTAAHCIESAPDDWKLENVVLGEWDVLTDEDYDRHGTRSEPVVVKKVVKTIVHESYRRVARNKHDDIALLRLASEVDFTNFVSPICLPLDALQWNRTYYEDDFSAAGFGRTEDGKPSTKKLKVKLPFRSFEECSRLFRKKGVFLKNNQHICAGVEGKDTCKGDSGGSLMYYNVAGTVPFWYAAGVVSFGDSSCGRGLPGVYTKIEHYLEWINQNIE